MDFCLLLHSKIIALWSMKVCTATYISTLKYKQFVVYYSIGLLKKWCLFLSIKIIDN